MTAALREDCRALRRKLCAHLGEVHRDMPPRVLLSAAQTLLHRALLIAFAEHRGLLPAGSLAGACARRDGRDLRSTWRSLQAVFRGIDPIRGAADPPASTRDPLEMDPAFDALEIPDGLCEELARLARYDFRAGVSVEVLGQIFEASIAELEELQAEAVDPALAWINVPHAPRVRLSRRRAEGVFYTPPAVTRLLVDQTLGRALDERWRRILEETRPEEQASERRRDAWIEVWKTYQAALAGIRVLDPACGAGAFLLAAFDALASEHARVNAALAELGAEPPGSSGALLEENFFGVDLDAGSVEITKLSLWLKAAEQGMRLAGLDGTIQQGNSVVSDPAVDARAFDWHAHAHARARPTNNARWREGFDVVIGNPPYVRHELLTREKAHLEAAYRAYHGMADLFVYFFERGLSLLKPGGRLGFVVANKWLRAGYAEPLRRLLAAEARLETLVDLGHARLFPDADASPCIVTMAKFEVSLHPEHCLEVTAFPREQLQQGGLSEYIRRHHHPVPQVRLGAGPWSLEPAAVESLMAKIRAAGAPLAEVARARPCYGIKTGLNEAFLMDSATRDRLVAADSRSEGVIKKYLRGQDVERWAPEWGGDWILLLQSSGDRRWPWSGQEDERAEATFRATFPALHAHLKPLEQALRRRTDKGRTWWELRPCAYYEAFEAPKLVYQEIQFHAAYAADHEGMFLNNKAFFLPCADPWILCVLNSPLMWWHNWRYLPHMKDETLSPTGVKMEALPMATPSDEARAAVEAAVPRLVAMAREDSAARAAVLDSLRMQFGVEAPGQKLAELAGLSEDNFVAEVLKRRPRSAGKLRAAALQELRALHRDEALPLQARRREAAGIERRLAGLVEDAYGLTPEEVELLWSTAPPRMPAPRPQPGS